MKSGDIVTCIKSRGIFNIEGNKYKILDILDNNSVGISVEWNHIGTECIYSLENNKMYYTFEEHFKTEKQIRKEKLKKLSNEK